MNRLWTIQCNCIFWMRPVVFVTCSIIRHLDHHSAPTLLVLLPDWILSSYSSPKWTVLDEKGWGEMGNTSSPLLCVLQDEAESWGAAVGCGKAFWSFLRSPDFADADRAVNSKTEGAQRATAKHFLPFPGTKFSFGHLHTTVVQDEIK